MRHWLTFAALCSCLTVAVFVKVEAECVIELECPECIPENMPLVTSHRAAGGAVRAAAGDEVLFSCGRGKFLSYPLRGELAARCVAGRYVVQGAGGEGSGGGGGARHLLELGCQESVFEDVLHHVEHCPAPLQGRAYELQDARGGGGGGGGTRHLALLCFDADRGLAARARSGNAARGALPLPAHAEPGRSPLTLLGNFNHMFDAKTRADAERLYGDDASTNRRLKELLKHEGHSFAGQTLTAGKLLSPKYFEDQNARITDFASNKIPVWKSVAEGNLQHLQSDIGDLMQRTRGNKTVEVHTGTHGVMSIKTEESRVELYLKGGQRFPVPKYIWSLVASGPRAVALVLLNDPFVAVSEVRGAVFCSSQCGALRWARAARRARRYESPLYGLLFCCEAHELAAVIHELPPELIRHIPRGAEGLLTDI